MTTPHIEWKGWAVAGTALYLYQPEGSDVVGMFLQYAADTRHVATFADVNAAAELQEWLDTALTAVGLANTELVKLVEPGG